MLRFYLTGKGLCVIENSKEGTMKNTDEKPKKRYPEKPDGHNVDFDHKIKRKAFAVGYTQCLTDVLDRLRSEKALIGKKQSTYLLSDVATWIQEGLS